MLVQGTYLGNRYEVIEKIGTGGMSDVYLAKDHSLDRQVAIKVLKQEYAEDMTFVSKFRAEAQAAAGLEHPNIVNIYDVGNENGLYYIVMERIEGVTLKTYIAKKGQLSYNEVISIAIQVGRGIEAAHNKNIVHRDIKPQNIMISKEGKVKVTDFGIARAVTSNTINADLMGSVHYSSPEQARNGFVSFQSDIYSLGIVMYEMCTGRVPFDGDTTVAIAIQHLQSEMTPPSVYAPNLPISVEKIIMKCTMKSQDRRYATIEDMLIDLKKALVNPDEDFVTIPDAEESEKTRVISEKELEQIQKTTVPEKTRDRDRMRDEDDDEDDDNDDIVNPKMDKAITIMGIAAAVVIIAIFTYLLGSFLGLFRFGGGKTEQPDETVTVTEEEKTTVSVPNLVGMTENEAKAALEKVGLGVKNNGTESSDSYAKGKIVSQSPDAGSSVEPNSTIKITISSGKGESAIPEVVGINENTAESMLKDAGFECIKEYTYSDSVAQGKVISQSPDAGSMGSEGDSVTLIVSQGTESVKVPNVIGQTETAGKAALEAAGFVTKSEAVYSDTIPVNCISATSTAAGEYAPLGSTIVLSISQGPQVSYYSFSMVADARDGLDTVYTLTDADGNTIEMWTVSSPTTISKNNITTSTGTLYYNNTEVGGNANGSQAVKFVKQP